MDGIIRLDVLLIVVQDSAVLDLLQQSCRNQVPAATLVSFRFLQIQSKASHASKLMGHPVCCGYYENVRIEKSVGNIELPGGSTEASPYAFLRHFGHFRHFSWGQTLRQTRHFSQKGLSLPYSIEPNHRGFCWNRASVGQSWWLPLLT